jgi:hypothetical protein
VTRSVPIPVDSRTQLTSADLASEYGFTARHWTRLAAEGKIPGARQPCGANGKWLFDTVVFQRWWKSREREVTQWPGYSAEVGRIGVAPNVRTENSGEASRRRTERLLKDALGRG